MVLLPLNILRAGFDVTAFQGGTFNFVYAEPTTTLGLPKLLFLLVMRLFALSTTLHSTAQLISAPPSED